MALRLDRSYTPVGEAVQLDEERARRPNCRREGVALARRSTLAYIKGRAQFQLTLLKGAVDSGIPLLRDVGSYSSPRFSPDGGKIALTTSSSGSSPTSGSTTWRVTRLHAPHDGRGSTSAPEWTPDGKSLRLHQLSRWKRWAS